MDIYALIANDHRVVEELFARLEEEPSARQRGQLFERLKAEILGHKEAEERTLYAVLSTLPDLADLIEEAIEEHVDAAELLQELEGLDPEEQEWLATLQELREEIEHHASAEEGEIFAAAKKALTAEQAKKLAREFQAAKERMTF